MAGRILKTTTYSGDGDVLWASNYGNLAIAINTIGATEATLIIDSPESLLLDATFPSTLSVEIMKPGYITIASGKVLTINGPFKGYSGYIFKGAGTVAGGSRIEKVYPQWFGVVGDGIVDDTSAIGKAIAFLLDGQILYFGVGKYKITSTITIDKPMTLRGDFPDWGWGNGSGVFGSWLQSGTLFKWAGASNGTMFLLDDTSGIRLADFQVDCGTISTGKIFYLKAIQDSTFDRIVLYNMQGGSGFYMEPKLGRNVMFNHFGHIKIADANRCIELHGVNGSNCCHNRFHELDLKYAEGSGNAGLWLGRCDNNSFYSVYISRLHPNVSDPLKGYGVIFSNDEWKEAVGNTFHHLQSDGGVKVEAGCTQNTIHYYSQSNSQPDPVIDTAGDIVVHQSKPTGDTKQKLSGFGKIYSDKVGINTTGALSLALTVVGQGQIKNTGASASMLFERTSGGGASITGAAWASSVFAFDDSQPMYFRAEPRADILAGVMNTGSVIMTMTGGKVGMGTTTPATSALLDLASTTKALLLSRMTTTQRNALTAVNGMVVYDITLNKFQKYENGSWQDTGGASGLWIDESVNNYLRPNNVINSGNTGVRVYDAGHSLLGQVAPTTGNNFGGGSCVDGTVLRVNDGNVGTPTANGTVPLWVKRYTNKDGTDWGCGAAYFGAVKTGGTNPLHTVVVDTYCQGGSIPASGGVLGSMLIHLKNDTCTAANQDIHNVQMVTYTPSSNYQGQHCCLTNDVCNRYADKGWLTRYAAGWTNAFNASNESTSNYDNSCAYSLGSGSGSGKWYIGYECNSIAYDTSLNKGEGIYFQTSTFDTHADCLRAEGNLDMRSGYDIASYYTNSFIVRTGRQNSYTDRMWITSAGNMTLTNTLTMYNNKAIKMKDNGGTARSFASLDTNNDWWIMSNGRYACIGANCSQTNPVLIRINGTNNCQLIRSPDVDSAGKHYVTLV